MNNAKLEDSQVRSSSKKNETLDSFILEMNEPWSEETARIAEQAYLAFSDVLKGELQIIQDKVANAVQPPEFHQNRDDIEYPEEFLEWLQENILGDETLADMSDEWEQLFYEWLLGTIMTVGRINYMTVGVSPSFDFVDDKLLEWINWRAKNSSIQIVGTSAERVRKLIYDVIADGPYSIDKIQEALQRDHTFSSKRARSIARTEVLTSQTTGQFASDMKFADEGLLLGKYWQDSNDSRVRDKHRHAHNQFREFYEPFNVGGQLMMYPRDTEMGASADNTIQCRCTYRLLWKDKDEDLMNQLQKNGIIDIEIGELTPCLRDMSTGELVDTKYKEVLITPEKAKKLQKEGWRFDWFLPTDEGDIVNQLTIKGKRKPEGYIAFRNEPGFTYVSLVESAPHNIGKGKKYDGVGGHLFAIAAEESFRVGNEGYVSFVPKTVLEDHYEKTLGAQYLPNGRMFLDTEASLKLIKKYMTEG